MFFNSSAFLGFFAIVVAGYFAVAPRYRLAWLLIASAGFVAYVGPFFLVLALVATTFAFVVARVLERIEKGRPARQTVLAFAIVALLANLATFKYAPFFNGLLGQSPEGNGLITLVLPVGISFYTLQLIGYLIDVYRGEQAERSLGVFALYALFFPKLVSGPIERGRNLLPQLHELPGFNLTMAIAGIELILWGAFKKFVVADRIAPFVDGVFGAPHEFDGVATAVATWLYAFQLYFDFSGYTDMALGAASILGIRLMQNFDRPYFATSVQDFWKRWHISLTSWLTDYLYTPITRAKWIRIKLYNLILIALMVTFLVSGLWHGSTWSFLAWGALHGTYIVLSLLLQKPWGKFAKAVGLTRVPRLYTAFKIARTFTLVCFAYILFRAASLEDALYMISNLHTGWGQLDDGIAAVINGRRAEILLALAGIVVVMAAELLPRRQPGVTVVDTGWPRWLGYYAAGTIILLFGAFYGDQQFIYFSF